MNIISKYGIIEDMEKEPGSNKELAIGIGLAVVFLLIAAGISVEPILV